MRLLQSPTAQGVLRELGRRSEFTVEPGTRPAYDLPLYRAEWAPIVYLDRFSRRGLVSSAQAPPDLSLPGRRRGLAIPGMSALARSWGPPWSQRRRARASPGSLGRGAVVAVGRSATPAGFGAINLLRVTVPRPAQRRSDTCTHLRHALRGIPARWLTRERGGSRFGDGRAARASSGSG